MNNHEEFKEAFWEWFDSLPKHVKKQFWYYHEDMAETNFYFREWQKQKEKNDEHEYF